MISVKVCPSILEPEYNNYSYKARKQLFNGSNVSCFHTFNSPKTDDVVYEQFLENRKLLSISGMQVKQSLTQHRNKLQLTAEGEQGTHILKPIPYGAEFRYPDELPANENLTMQIASQVYGIKTAANGLIFFRNGEPAYITKRFDLHDDGSKISQEDLTVLLGLSMQISGPEYKYEGSYQKAADILKIFLPAYQVESERFFERVLFNFLFSNGDAHLRNFSVQQLPSGDHVLSPAYDLINTRLHIQNESAMALRDGLFDNDYSTKSFEKNGFFAYDDFYEFGLAIGLIEKRMKRILDNFRNNHPKVYELTRNSFLSDELKKVYIDLYIDRLKALNYSFEKRV